MRTTAMRAPLLLLLLAAFARAAVVIGDECAGLHLNREALERPTGGDLRTLVALVDRPLWRMEAWTAARLHAQRDGIDAAVVVACRSAYERDEPTVGVAFAEFTPGMDCGSAHVDAVFAEVEALDERDRHTVRIERLVSSLERWHRTRRCSVGTEGSRAALFWALAGVLATIIARVYRQRTPPQERRRPAERARAARR